LKIQVLYDQGSARVLEDGIVFQPPYFFGATDGISGVYLPHEGPKLFAGKTGGQLASYVISKTFGDAMQGTSLEDILREANNKIRTICETSGLSLQESELLPSAAFAVASISNHEINILQGGDSLAIWEMKDRTLGGTPNRTYSYEEYLLSTIAELMMKHRGDRQKMWEEFRPTLIKKRRANINTLQGRFALLNGQPEFEQFWQNFTFRRDELRLLILFSDGFVPFEWTKDENTMAKMVVDLYHTGGLYQVLTVTREIAQQNKSSSHEDFAEATAVAIEF
jgi:serine/threonine protein phosphatase PrpC